MFMINFEYFKKDHLLFDEDVISIKTGSPSSFRNEGIVERV